ncbi:hypothetical protein SADUNF_Sadunf18G0080600 [Salix dunnii]|uniref:Uncharacterized protein n=1 Tax=Salix dunnii TaxID=1413687 RepID=A0A835MJ16_9ROSI|nr:hypothetical protein SADUNF_Sadunf18G0080600 [Salix dunnii]
MVKRVLLGVQKKKNPIKIRFLKKIEDYMKSDSYMFARFIIKPHIASNTSTSSTTVETKECMKERNKRLLEKVGDYLKSDTYMYAPLCAQQAIYSKTARPVDSEGKYAPLSPDNHNKKSRGVLGNQGLLSTDEGHVRHIKKTTMEFSAQKLTTKDNKSTAETSNASVEDQFSELPEKCIPGQLKFVHKETVKHMVYQSCRSSLSGYFLMPQTLFLLFILLLTSVPSDL